MEGKQLDTFLLKKGYTVVKKLNNCQEIIAYLVTDEKGINYVVKVTQKRSNWIKVIENEYKKLKDIDILNIPQVIECFSSEKFFGIILSYIPGKTLRELKVEKKLTWGKVRNIFLLILQTLSELHSKGYVHCDLKPQNVLYDRDEIFLIDFAASRKLNENSTFIQFTPKYSQNLECLINRCDERIDLYSLLKILKFLLLGSEECAMSTLPLNLRLFIKKGTKESSEEGYQNTEEVLKAWDLLGL